MSNKGTRGENIEVLVTNIENDKTMGMAACVCVVLQPTRAYLTRYQPHAELWYLYICLMDHPGAVPGPPSGGAPSAAPYL